MSDHPFDSAKYRQVLGHFPTGVTVITAAPDGVPVGLAVGSFSSVSLDPPLVAFFPDRSSSSWPKIEAAGAFCVNILGEEQEEVCRRFAMKGDDKFAGLGWKPAGATGSPLLDGVVAWIDCDIESVTDAGDHFCVMGLVRELEVAHDGPPLLFFRGGYGRFAV
jgi:3-hydroxy-9,10-secoandrosta-1,3,5(10)-triene-9,17-dione monooxygenase reductase component